MKTKMAAIALIGSLLASPAFAWGDREQGALAGIASALIWQRLNTPQVVGPVHVPVPQGPMIGQYPTNPYPYVITPTCRQVLAIQYDRFGNEFRYPVTVCN